MAEAAPVQSFIVEAESTDAAAQAVKDAGGEVVSRLGVIDAVEANLTDAARTRVSKAAGVKQITPNTLVSTQATSNAANVADHFETGSFDNDDGTHRWWGGWVEQNDNNSPYDGKISIGWMDHGGKRLLLTGGASIYRKAATPSSSPAVTLKFKYQRVGLEWNDHVSVQASANGGATWTEIGRLSGAGTDGALVSRSYDITAYRGRNTAIRFVSSMDGYYPSDYVAIDDVEIDYTTTYGSGDPAPVDISQAELHNAGIRGNDVGVAIIDTGYWAIDSLEKNSHGNERLTAQYDAVHDVLDSQWSGVSTDTNGHGTHVASLIASSRKSSTGRYFGVAPDARLISVKAFAEDGSGSYASVIRGIDWVVTNRYAYNIRILNLSLGAPAHSRYWDDPLNKAVMHAWQSGIVVVVSAGNSGPLPQTVGVPGNVPYVITVGAMTDNFTPSKSDDKLASFSSTGPTFEGFVKPDLVAPGGHVWGFMATYDKIAVDHPTYMNNGDFFTMSGTSQAAAVVSGVAALVIGSNPGLTPDQVKCRILSSGRPAVNSDGSLAYSVLQQGTGMVDARNAVYGTANSCANQGLDIAADLSGARHFMGRVRQLADGTFKVTNPDGTASEKAGYTWDQGFIWPQGFVWPQGFIWPQGFVWQQASTYSTDIDWAGGYPSAINNSANTASAMSINAWVAPE